MTTGFNSDTELLATCWHGSGSTVECLQWAHSVLMDVGFVGKVGFYTTV